MDIQINFWENFTESIAQIMSRALTDDENERLLSSFQSFHARLRKLSSENLEKLEREAPLKRPFCKHKGTCSQNTIRGFVSSFAIAYATKYALDFLPALVTGKIYKKPATLLKIAGKDTTSFALFLSAFISLYKGTLCLLRKRRQKSDADGINPLIAGTVAGLSIIFDQNQSRRIMIALYLSTRNLHFVCRWLWRRYLERLLGNLDDEEVSAQTPDESTCSSPRSNLKLELKSPTYGDKGGSGRKIFEIERAVSPTVSMENSLQVQLKNLSVQIDTEKAESYRNFFRQLAGTAVMMLSSAQILYAFVCAPDTLAKPYLSFLLTHGNIRTLHPQNPMLWLNAIGSVINSSQSAQSTKFLPTETSSTLPPPIFESSIPRDINSTELLQLSDELQEYPHEFILCGLQHPHSTECWKGFLAFFLAEWPRAVALYGPLNAIMTIVFKGRKVLTRPLRSLTNYITGTLRSALFLSSYTTIAWSLPCIFRTSVGKDAHWMYVINGIIAGATVLIEVPGRRLELGMYCLPRALESFWNCGVKWKWWKNVRNGELIYFCLSTGVLMTLYQLDPESIHDGYRKVMIRFFGVN